MYSKMNFTKKMLLPTLFALSLLVAACGGSNGSSSTGVSTTKAAASKQIYIRPYAESDLKTLDPALETDLYSAQAINMVFSGLVEQDNSGKIQPELAQSYSLGSDNVTWTFHLRSGLKFSDGTSLTSADIVYSIDRALQPATKSSFASGYLGLIKDSDKLAAGKIKTIIGDSLKTPDANTVVIVTSKPAAYFLESLSVQTSYIVEKSLITKYGATNWTDHLSSGGGSGPWIVSKYIHGKEIDFTPNPYYFGPKPLLKEVVRPFYANADTIYKAYQVNQVDSASIPTADLAAAKALPNNQYHLAPSLSNAYYTMNYLVKPFDNIKIREAFDLAIDKDAIVKDVYKGEFIASNHIIPEGMPGYNPSLTRSNGIKDTTSHAALAKQLFTEGLTEDGLTLATLPPITFTVSTQGSVDVRNEEAAEQQMWQTALGVKVSFDDVDFNKLITDTSAAINNPKGIMAWGLGWIDDYPDPQDWTTLQFDNGAVNNGMNYGQNKSSDVAAQLQTQKLLEEADANQNAAQRIQQYDQAEQQLVNDVAWMTVFQETSPYVIKSCVQGVVINAQDIPTAASWSKVYISNASDCANTSSY